MTPEQVIDLLSTAAAFDRRTVGDADVIAWHSAIGELDFADAQAAVVRHYQQTRDFVMPSDVRALVKLIRAERLAREAVPAPDPELSDDARAYQDQLKRNIARLASGWSIGRALAAPKTDPNDAYTQARGGDRDPKRIAAIKVPCPWPPCQAPRGSSCVDAQGRRLTAPAHEARLKAAGIVDGAA